MHQIRVPGQEYQAGDGRLGCDDPRRAWDSEDHAVRMDRLKEMTVDARGQAETVGVMFTPIVDYPINWTI